MRQILTNRLLLLFLLLVGVSGVQAQERLYDLTVNHRLSDYEKYMRSDRYASRAAGDTLDLPFFDDFSEPFSRLRNLGDDYPNPDRWIGNTVYINNHMAINPISQGVATFDGLDEMGRAYGFGFSLPSDADSLTSKPIRLSGTLPDSSVVLSFYYQAQELEMPLRKKTCLLCSSKTHQKHGKPCGKPKVTSWKTSIFSVL